ncbi:6880_t:CDS:2, partial [Acaulospora colombiana]
DELSQWFIHFKDQLPDLDPQQQEIIHDLTGDVPLLLRPLFKFQKKGFNQKEFQESEEFYRVRVEVAQFFKARFRALQGRAEKNKYVLFSDVFEEGSYDQRYFYMEESMASHTCRVAAEAMTLLLQDSVENETVGTRKASPVEDWRDVWPGLFPEGAVTQSIAHQAKDGGYSVADVGAYGIQTLFSPWPERFGYIRIVGCESLQPDYSLSILCWCAAVRCLTGNGPTDGFDGHYRDRTDSVHLRLAHTGRKRKSDGVEGAMDADESSLLHCEGQFFAAWSENWHPDESQNRVITLIGLGIVATRKVMSGRVFLNLVLAANGRGDTTGTTTAGISSLHIRRGRHLQGEGSEQVETFGAKKIRHSVPLTTFSTTIASVDDYVQHSNPPPLKGSSGSRSTTDADR